MSQAIPGSEPLKGKENREKMEGDETSTCSDLAVGLTPRSLSTASGGAPTTGISQSGPTNAETDLPVQGSMVSREMSAASSQTTPPTSEGASKKSNKKSIFEKTSDAWKNAKSFFKTSPKKPDKLAIVAVEATEDPPRPSTAAKKSRSQGKSSKNRPRLTLDESPDDMDTFMTEVPSSQDSVFKDCDRKASVASCDTGAHISRLPSLDSSSGKELEKESPKEKDTRGLGATPVKPREAEGQ